MSELNQLVRDLVQGDANLPSGGTLDAGDGFDQIPYIVKQVFQVSDVLMQVWKKEVEIERMCGLHYQEFVQSVDQLLKVRSGTSSINDRIVNMNNGIQETGKRMLEKKRELVENRQKLLNIELTLEAVQSCLFVLDISNRVSIQIVNKKYFSALRMIQELQTSHLKLVRGFSFSKLITNWLPQVQEAIRESVLRDLKDWFTSIKEGAPRIGKLALDLTSLRQERANEIMNTKASSLGSVRSFNQTTSLEMIMTEEFDANGIDTDSAELDFTPLFQCIHIHEVLGKRIQLKLEFDESRRLQAEVILHQPILSLKTDDLRSLERYIHEIAGFFVIEATVISTTQDFRSRSSVETLWQTCTGKMNAHLFEALSECTNPDLYLDIKLLVNSFISTMEIYGYAVNSLIDLMVSLLDRYAELMRAKCICLVLKTINEDDDYSPLVLRDTDELEDIMCAYAIPEDILKSNTSKRDSSIIFPKVLPFSKGLPQSCKFIRDMITGFYRFADGFSQQNHEIDDLLKKTLESLLQSVNSAYLERISTGGISVVYQLMINLQFFGNACEQFEDLLMEKRYTARTMRVSLFAAKSFTETCVTAEQKIHLVINAKSDSFLDLVDYQWKMTQPRRQVSPFLQDLIGFLTTVMSSTLADLPPKSKGVMYFEAFEHLSASIKSMMLDVAVEHITLAALETVEYDVLFLESACRKLQDNNAQDSFVELKQLIAFGRSEKYEDFLQPSIKNKKYARVELDEAIMLLDKLRNFGNSWFSTSITAEEKAFKNAAENALKMLKVKQA